MTITVQSSDGMLHQFPDGTDPDVIDRAMKTYAAQSQPPASDNSGSSPKTSQLLGFGQALSNAGENVYNGLGWVLNKLGVPAGANGWPQSSVQDTPSGKAEDAKFDPSQNGGYTPGAIGRYAGDLAISAPISTLATQLLGPFGPSVGGAVAGALTGQNDSAGDLAKNTALGAAETQGGTWLAHGAARVIAPTISPAVQALLDMKIPLTVGQTLGGLAKSAEDKAMSLPIVGDAIAAARQRSIDGLNRALGNHALEPIKQIVPDDVPVGRQMIAHVQGAIGKVYDNALSQATGVADPQLASDLSAVVSNAQAVLPKPQYDRFAQIVQNQVIGKIGNTPTFGGDTYKDITSEVGRLAAGYGGSQSVDDRALGDVLGSVNDAMESMLRRNNPRIAPTLDAADQAWSRYAVLRDAASRTGSTDGVITPSTFQAAVRNQDGSVAKGAFARGDARMQDISDAAKAVIPSSVPDSGTGGRLMAAGALASGLYHPAIPASLIGGALAYTAPAQRVMGNLVTGAPATRAVVANWLTRLANPTLGSAILSAQMASQPGP